MALSANVQTIDLRPGMRGALVTDLQKMLKAWGFDPGAIDGAYGPKTAEAVRALQRKIGVEASGTFNSATRDAVTADLESSASAIKATSQQHTLPQLDVTTSAMAIDAPFYKRGWFWAVALGAVALLVLTRRTGLAGVESAEDYDDGADEPDEPDESPSWEEEQEDVDREDKEQAEVDDVIDEARDRRHDAQHER